MKIIYTKLLNINLLSYRLKHISKLYYGNIFILINVGFKPNMKKIIVFSSCIGAMMSLYAAPIEQRNLSNMATPSTVTTPQQSTQFWELHQQIQQLQNQVRELRGLIEEQNNQIEQLENETQNRYTDLDQRIEILNEKIDPDSVVTEDSTETQNASNNTSPNIATNLPLDQAAYNMAYDAYKNGGAAKAIAPMQNFIKNHPTSPYVSNAYYWLGEFNLSLTPANFNQAKENFEIVAGNYPQSSKAAAALYRLSEIAKNIDKDIPKARSYYLKLIQNYSNSTEAETAKTSLNL